MTVAEDRENFSRSGEGFTSASADIFSDGHTNCQWAVSLLVTDGTMDNSGQSRARAEARDKNSDWWWVIGVGCLLVVLLGILIPRGERAGNPGTLTNQTTSAFSGTSTIAEPNRMGPHHSRGSTKLSAEEIVATKLSQFARNRREVLRAMAKRYGVEIPADVERFFETVETGKWDQIQAAFDGLMQQRKAGNREDLKALWGPILETFGVAESTHLWPAQKLLDYGNAILDSLRPGMIYVGGTDPGRFIPTFLNETSEGEHHIVLTQNAMADNTYLKYVDFLYGDKFGTLKESDSQSAFEQYLAEAQKRLKHDQEFPNEPKQIRPGEEIQMADNRLQVSGQVAVMGINELLLQDFMNKNPDASFALEESFPLKSFYSNSVPLGPIMELRSQDAFTSERASQVLDYWRGQAQQLLSDRDDLEGSDPRKTYSKLISSQANLLADHHYSAEAEQAYRLATQLEPSSPEAAYGLANILASTGRADEARQIVDSFQQRDPTINTYGQAALWNAKGTVSGQK